MGRVVGSDVRYRSIDELLNMDLEDMRRIADEPDKRFPERVRLYWKDQVQKLHDGNEPGEGNDDPPQRQGKAPAP